MTVYRYPLNPPVTGSTAVENPTQLVHYVMFQRKRISYDDSNDTNYYGLNVPNNSVATENNKARVYIAMPQDVQTAYQPTYRKVDMGVTGLAMAEGLSSSDLDGVVTALQTAAGSAIPELTTGALAQAAQGAAQMLGLAGNADANALMALTQGKVFNPYSEQLFSNMQFRTHNFSFKMFACSEDESKEINNIIKYLKQGALPIYGDSDTGKAARFFEVPDKFDIKFVRLSPDGKTLSDSEDLHYKIHTSVCTGVSVNYTPDGQYNAIKNNNLGTGEDKPLQVPVVSINLRFTETQLVTQQQIKEGY